MEDLILKMIEAAKADRTKLIEVKKLAVKLQQYELASKLKDLENELFPLSKEDNELKRHAAETATALKMAELNATNANAFVVYSIMQVLNEKGGSFSLKDAAEIMAKRKQLYPTED